MLKPNIWKQEWYECKDDAFVTEVAQRKSWALTAIILFTIVVAFFAGRASMGQLPDIIAFAVAFVLFGLATLWFRVSYLCEQEMQRRGLSK